MLDTIQDIDLTSPGAPSLVLRDLSEYVTLPFIAAFDVPEPAATGRTVRSKTPQKRVTYIGLSRQTMPQLVDLFLAFKDDTNVYNDGTIEAILSVSHIRFIFLLFPNYS